MTALLDARFAGGPLEVSADHFKHAPETAAVRIDGPGFSLALFPHEARALAAALIVEADDATR